MRKKIAAVLSAGAIVVALGACDEGNPEFQQREQAQTAKKAKTDSLEIRNLKKKLAVEEKADQIGYVYLVSFAKPMGYYVIKGKVSSSGSQLSPEDDVIRDAGQYGGGNVVTDGPQDDGTYGAGDPGIFFFTSDGVMVHTSLDYVYSTAPLAIDVPLLGK